MGYFLAFIGMVLFPISIVYLIVNIIKKKEKKKALILLGSSIVVFIIGGILMPPTNNDKSENKIEVTEPTETKKSNDKKVQKAANKKETTKATDTTEKPKASTITVQSTLDDSGEKVFEKEYRSTKLNWDYGTIKYNEDGSVDEENSVIDYLNIEVELADNLTENMMIKGFLMKVSDFLKETKDINYNRVFIGAKTDFKDKYGNIKEEYAVKIEFSKEEIDKINFKNFSYTNLPDIATTFNVHNGIDYNLK